MPSDWLKHSRRFLCPPEVKPKPIWLAYTLSPIRASCRVHIYFEFWLDRWNCLRLLWLLRVITLLLVFRRSIENSSTTQQTLIINHLFLPGQSSGFPFSFLVPGTSFPFSSTHQHGPSDRKHWTGLYDPSESQSGTKTPFFGLLSQPRARFRSFWHMVGGADIKKSKECINWQLLFNTHKETMYVGQKPMIICLLV